MATATVTVGRKGEGEGKVRLSIETRSRPRGSNGIVDWMKRKKKKAFLQPVFLGAYNSLSLSILS